MPGSELIGLEELNEIKKLFKNGSYLMRHAGPKGKYSPCKEAEKLFANYLGSEESLLVSSGTAAIRIALQSLNPKKGSYIITQPFTFIATFEAILDIGCVPVSIPLDSSLGMSSALLEEFLKKHHENTSAIMPVHMLGEACDIENICKIANKFKIPVIEDNCEALGGSLKGKMLGNWGELGTYSFDYGKILTSGEGGLISGSKKSIYSSYKLHDHGHAKESVNRAKEMPSIKALNFRYSELQASVLLAQFAKLENILLENKKRYISLQNQLNRFQRPMHDGCMPSFDTYMIKTGKKTDKVISELEKNNLSTKNIPVAMNWHCSNYWKHLDFIDFESSNEKSINLLSNYVAIPISLSLPTDFYIDLGEKLKSIME